MKGSGNRLWSKQAERWSKVGSPTRPCEEDIQIMWHFVQPLFVDGKSKQVAVMGVTPEVVHLPWPSQAHIEAFDASAEMINKLWQPKADVDARVRQSDWRRLPLPDQSVDLMVGDGIFTAAGSESVVKDMLTEAHRVLVKGGMIILRCFIRPETIEDLQSIKLAALAGKIRNFGSLKWRLAMALIDPVTSTVAPVRIHEVFQQLFPDRELLQLVSGWTIEQIGTIDAYDGMAGQFYFPDMQQQMKLLRRHVEIGQYVTGSYELSERCPLFQLIVR